MKIEDRVMSKKEKGFTLLELLVVVVILGIISLIASAMLLNALYKAKDSAIKANISAAASTLTASMALDDNTAEEAVTSSLSDLNDPDRLAGSGDEIKSPYDSTLDGFLEGDTGDKGQVAIQAISSTMVTIKGFGRNGSDDDPIAAKTITADVDNSLSSSSASSSSS